MEEIADQLSNQSKEFDDSNDEKKLDQILQLVFIESIKAPDLQSEYVGFRIDSIFEILETKMAEIDQRFYLQRLIGDGYLMHPFLDLRKTGKLNSAVTITDSGKQFIFNGGYCNQREIHARDNEHLNLQIQLNKQLIRHNRSTQWAIWIGAVFAIVSALVAVLTYLKA